MSQLDQIVASVEDSILPGMNYSLDNRKGASFVHQRVLSTLLPDHQWRLLAGIAAVSEDHVQRLREWLLGSLEDSHKPAHPQH